MVVFDTSILAIALDATAAVPIDPLTGSPLVHARKRIDHLLKTLSESRAKILLPTPVVAEYIAGGGPDKEKRLEMLTGSRSFKIVSFDLRAAVECGLIQDSDAGRKLSDHETKAKVKYDRQIIAIALAQGAGALYTGDKTLATRATAAGISAILTWDLPMPPEPPQMLFDYDVGSPAT